MLLPSALSCDSSQRPNTRLSSPLFSSPPASPPTNAYSGINSIMTSCRALHSMLAPAPVIVSGTDEDNIPRRASQLPTPPLAHATIPSPMKLRLRARKQDISPEMMGRKKIVKRAPPPRGQNKRRRSDDDDMGRDDDIDSDLDIHESDSADEGSHSGPRTPKRARIAPEIVPLGLVRSDFHNLHKSNPDSEQTQSDEEVEVEADGERWSTEEDRMLVELILEKLKLSKNDWQDCARSLGKDRSSIGRRWKSLMVNGDVGLKSRSSRRGKIHGTWR
ncbi:hypothetical protein G7054_g11487 [Neopestalotiopsis clavispora]|nr:hypothetical protein G7054_g11487 [Neopestalotiopsis clavispora]